MQHPTSDAGRPEPDQRYRNLFLASPAPFLILKPDVPRFTIVEVNDAYLAATMRKRNQVIGRGVFEAYPDNPDDPTIEGVNTLRASLERVLATHLPDTLPDLKYDVARPDGTFEEHWWSPVNSAVLDANGEVEAIIHNANDVTQQHRVEAARNQAEEALRASEAKYRALEARQAFLLKFSDALRAETGFDAIGERAVAMVAEHLRLDRCWISEVFEDQGISTVGPERIRPGLPPMAGVFQLSDYPETMRQLMVERMFAEDAAADTRFADSEKELFAGLQLRALLVVPLRKGERHVVWALAAAMAEPRQWTDADRALLEDVAERTWAALERARTEKMLQENQQRLEDANRTKDQFLAMLGHELRNPLAPIVTTLQLMKLRAPDTFKHEREIIESQAHALVEMVDDLLDVARITRGDLKLDKHPLRIADVVAEAIETAASTLAEHQQSLHTDIQPNLRVLGDRRRLVQVVVNLLVNAAKYSPPDRRIDIEAKAIGEFAVIRVRDQGEGLDAELQSRVFEAFTQARQTLDRRRGGLGLGLAIVRNLVELHGGSVAATSEGKGRGSEFSVRLPLLGGAGDEPFADAPIATAPASFGNVSTRVLLVDDHVAGAQSMRDLLQAMGYAVHIEHSGPAALAAVQACQPTIALLDIGLPGMDGYALARALHAMPGFSKLPLIALTGYGQAEDRERTCAAGFDEHVTKPVRADELVSLMEKLVHA